MSWFHFSFPDFALSLLSILFEGIPFLLLGSILSGAIDAFLPARVLTRLVPGNENAGILLSGLLGLVFPMCECGSVVVVRRFIRKGLPVSCAITYMLGAPIVSPLVALSTYAAFRGQSPLVMTSLRMFLGFLLAISVGFIVRHIPHSRLLQPSIAESLPQRLRPAFRISPTSDQDGPVEIEEEPFRKKIGQAIQAAGSDFLDVAFFFVIGASFAAVFNTAIDQAIIAPLATAPLLSILAMMGLAFALALCSSTDAFIAANFTAFPFAAKLAFLVFGPVFDAKLFFLYGAIFRRWFVVALLVGLFLAVALICARISVMGL